MVPTGTLSPATGQNCNPSPLPDVSRIRNQGALIDAFVWIMRLARNRKRYCFASNDWLADKLGCSVDKISRLIDRLRQLGAIVVEQVVGIERRVRPIVTLEFLKALLFRGDTANRIAPPARKSPPRSSVAAPSTEGSAEPVAEGHKRESFGLRFTPPAEEGQQTQAPASPVVVSSPTASPATDPQLVAAIEAMGIPRATAQRLVASKPAEIVRQAVRAVQQLHHSGKARNVGALLTTAIKEGWRPSAPEHSKAHTDRPVRVVRAPKEWLERVAAQERGTSPTEGPLGALEALRAKTRAYRMADRERGRPQARLSGSDAT